MPIPLMSVTFPTRNRADLLAHALESVLTVGTANADRCTIEILVIDDGSTDHTAQVVRRYPVQLLQTQNAHGASAARNVGLAQARGDFMTFLDDDDLRLQANVSTLLTWLERHPAAGAAWGLAQRTTPDLAPLGAPLPEGMAVSGWIFEQLLSFWPQLGATGCGCLEHQHGKLALHGYRDIDTPHRGSTAHSCGGTGGNRNATREESLQRRRACGKPQARIQGAGLGKGPDTGGGLDLGRDDLLRRRANAVQ